MAMNDSDETGVAVMTPTEETIPRAMPCCIKGCVALAGADGLCVIHARYGDDLRLAARTLKRQRTKK